MGKSFNRHWPNIPSTTIKSELDMFYGNTIEDTRQMFYTSWQKYQEKEQLLPLEEQIVAVILEHPEYHKVLANDSTAAVSPDVMESNPFLHMGLHLAIRDQITTDRPLGIKALFQEKLIHYGNQHDVEHLLMEQLAECLWQAQRSHAMPDEQAFLNACRKL